MGVWIETAAVAAEPLPTLVTPFVGVWIETDYFVKFGASESKSHPSWVCGLKLLLHDTIIHRIKSHPSWVCGLKLIPIMIVTNLMMSHPSWVCGLKP